MLLQILQRHDLLLGQRAEPADKHMRSGSEQRMKADPIFPHRPAQDRLIERIQIQYADLASQPGHIFDDLMGLRLTDAKIILFSAMFFQQLDECFYRKRIMLCGDTELMADRGSAEITLFDQCRLLDHLFWRTRGIPLLPW